MNTMDVLSGLVKSGLKNAIFLFIILSMMAACEDPTPKEVLDKQEMASILIEMYIRESEINEAGINPDSVPILHQLLLKETLEKKNIPEDTYVKSYDYYIENLKKFGEVYDIVIDSLKLRQNLAQNQPVPPPTDMVMEPNVETAEDNLIGPTLPPIDSTLLRPFDSIPPDSIELLDIKK